MRATDARLRRHGFIIWARRTGRAILWKRRGAILTEEQALRVCEREEEKAQEENHEREAIA